MLNAITDYDELISKFSTLEGQEKIDIVRHLARRDLFFLLYFVLGRKDMRHQWLIDRCKEVQETPNNCLDLWAREHYKSTIITYGKTIQDILGSHGDDPLPEWEGREVTAAIFSFNRPIAKGFLRQIKREFEANELLRACFPDVIWDKPHKDAPKWSEDDGITLKRKSNPKESTLEAWGMVDGQPTSKHFLLRVYDDVVTRESVTTPDMIHKVTEAWELSTNLGTEGGYQRYIGTRYHNNDTYRTLIDRDVVKLRKYTPYKDNGDNGESVLKGKEELIKKRKEMGPYTFACQMLQNPVADEKQGFKLEWLKYYEDIHGAKGMNKYILCDPANEKKKTSDYTTIAVLGLGPDNNYYLLDCIRDRLNLTERTHYLMQMHRKWQPKRVGYEQYGMQSDIQHIKYIQNQENYRFEVTPLGGKVSKLDRIKALVPVFEAGRFYLPNTLHRTLYDKKTVDLVDIFIQQEYLAFPVPVHDDMLDCLARILDDKLGALWPKLQSENGSDRYGKKSHSGSSCWAI